MGRPNKKTTKVIIITSKKYTYTLDYLHRKCEIDNIATAYIILINQHEYYNNNTG